MENRVYVSNFPYDLDKEELEILFKPFGPIIKSEIVYDPHTRRSRGCGYIDFQSDIAAHDAFRKMNGMPVKGRTIIVSKTDKKKENLYGKFSNSYLSPQILEEREKMVGSTKIRIVEFNTSSRKENNRRDNNQRKNSGERRQRRTNSLYNQE